MNFLIHANTRAIFDTQMVARNYATLVPRDNEGAGYDAADLMPFTVETPINFDGKQKDYVLDFTRTRAQLEAFVVDADNVFNPNVQWSIPVLGVSGPTPFPITAIRRADRSQKRGVYLHIEVNGKNFYFENGGNTLEPIQGVNFWDFDTDGLGWYFRTKYDVDGTELERLPGYFVRMQLRGQAAEDDIVVGSLPGDPITVRSVIGKWFAGGTYVTTTISTDWGNFDLGHWNRSGLHLIDVDTLLPEIKTEHRWVKDMPQMKV